MLLKKIICVLINLFLIDLERVFGYILMVLLLILSFVMLSINILCNGV